MILCQDMGPNQPDFELIEHGFNQVTKVEKTKIYERSRVTYLNKVNSKTNRLDNLSSIDEYQLKVSKLVFPA